MKKLNFITAALLAITPLFVTAQVNQTPRHTGGNQITTMKEKSEPATGSMFVNDRFMPAKLSNNENPVLVRYNAYSDFFEVSNPQKENQTTLPKDPNVKITFVSTRESYVYTPYTNKKGEAVSGYLNIVSDTPNVKIYKKESIMLQPESFPENSYQSYKAANYKRSDDEFFVKVKDQGIVYLEGKKELAKLAPEKSKEILEFVKKNKIDLEEEQDLLKLGEYMQSIL